MLGQHLRHEMGLLGVFVQGQGSMSLVSPFQLRVFCGCDSLNSAVTVQLLAPRGLDVQGFGDGAYVSFDIFVICFVYFSVSILLLTT